MKKKEILSVKQTYVMMLMVIISEILIMTTDRLDGNGTWLTFIIPGTLSFFLFFVYHYIMKNFPEKDIFDIFKILLGNFVGKIVSILFILFAMYVAYFALATYVTFNNLFSFQDTPVFAFGTMVILAIGYAIISKGGIEAVARTVSIFLPIIIGTWFLMVVLLSSKMEFDNLLPLVTVPFKEILKTSHENFSNTSGDLILFLGLLIDPGKKTNRLKAFYLTNVIGVIIFVINGIFITSIIGVHLYYQTFFPTYNVISLFNIGSFISRVELVISLLFFLCIGSKIIIGVYVASVGTAKVFNTKNYRNWVFPICAVILFFATYNHSHMHHYDINKKILWVKSIIQVGIPIIIAIVLLIKKPKLMSLGLIEET